MFFWDAKKSKPQKRKNIVEVAYSSDFISFCLHFLCLFQSITAVKHFFCRLVVWNFSGFMFQYWFSIAMSIVTYELIENDRYWCVVVLELVSSSNNSFRKTKSSEKFLCEKCNKIKNQIIHISTTSKQASKININITKKTYQTFLN